MNQVVFRKAKEELTAAAPFVAKIAAAAMNSPLEELLCLLSGVSPERLRELANDGNCAPSELLALCAAAEFVNAPLRENPLPAYSFPMTRGGLYPFAPEAAGELDKAAPGDLRNLWLGNVTRNLLEAEDFCGDLVAVSDANSQEEFFASYHFFLDASVLCSKHMPDFLSHFFIFAKKRDKPLRITVPQTVITALEEMAANPDQAELSGAREGIRQLKQIQDADLLSVRGDSSDITLLSTFFSAFSRYKPNYRMVFLTQDETLANSIQLLNESALEGSDILIASLGDGGYPAVRFKSVEREPLQAVGKEPAQEKPPVAFDVFEAELPEESVTLSNSMPISADALKDYMEPQAIDEERNEDAPDDAPENEAEEEQEQAVISETELNTLEAISSLLDDPDDDEEAATDDEAQDTGTEPKADDEEEETRTEIEAEIAPEDAEAEPEEQSEPVAPEAPEETQSEADELQRMSAELLKALDTLEPEDAETEPEPAATSAPLHLAAVEDEDDAPTESPQWRMLW